MSGFETKVKMAATVLLAALCVVGVALLGSEPTRANEVPSRFVSPNGSNDGLCRQQDPCRDIVTAINIAKIYDGPRSNAEIWIAAGEYNAGFGINSNVQLRGEGADQVKINVDSGSTGISLYSQEDAGTTNVTMSGLTIQAKPRPEGFTGSWVSRGIGIQPHGGGAGHRLTLENVTVKNFEWFESGAGIFSHGGHLTLKENTVIENNRATGQGGGIYALGGSVNVENSVIKNNRATSYGGGISADQASLNVSGSKIGNNTGAFLGGGINANVVTMNNTAVGGNTLQNGNGGGVFAATSLTASNSSFVGNDATGGGGSGAGGGLSTRDTTLTNVTVGGNSAASNGGGVWANGTTSVTNTLIAGNTAPSGPHCQATLSTTNGHNMVGNNSGCGGLTNNQNGNRVGTPSNPINPRLYELEIDDIPAAMELLRGSPANSAGHAATCLAAPINDKSQFGGSRNTAARGNKCDIGAYDYGEQIPAGVPDAPTNVTGSAGNGTVALNWMPGYDGGSGTNGYTITCSPACPEGTTGLSLSSGQPGTTIRGLQNGTSYTFRVAAKNLVGTGPASAPSAAITAVAAPGAPTNVQATAGSGSATLTWTAPPNNGAEISSYRITCDPACGSGGSPVAGNPAPTTTAMTGLANGTSYTFQVRATNSAGEGQPSDSSNAVVPNAPP
ncbi:MAG: fibronectin type III domain-containing protein, partial [Rubrobacteraceae bacterium]